MDDLASRLADVRRHSGLSTRGFAAALEQAADYGVSHTSVGGYEHGTGVPAVYVEAVSRTFGVSAAWLLSGSGLPAEVDEDEAREALRRIADVTHRRGLGRASGGHRSTAERTIEGAVTRLFGHLRRHESTPA